MNYNEIKAIAKDSDYHVADLIALARKNDPFYRGSKGDLIKAQWFKQVWTNSGYSTGVHLRRIHYRIVSTPTPKPDGTPYENTIKDWNYLNLAAKCARYLGLVAPSAFVDRRNPDPHVFAEWFNPRPGQWDDPTPRTALQDDPELWPQLTVPDPPQLEPVPDLPDLPHYEIEGYEYNQQLYHLEIWTEKTTMNDVLEPICRETKTNLVTGPGELSITSVVALMARVAQARRPARILYISDFDPAGLGMPISIARKIEFFQRENGRAHLDIRLEPIVLTAQQLTHYHLPRVPVKDSDKRKARFEADHGEGQVELDALEALYPGELAKIVTREINRYYDPELNARTRNARSEAKQAQADLEADLVKHYQWRLDEIDTNYDELYSAFNVINDQFNELAAQLQPALDDLNAQLQVISANAEAVHTEIADDFRANLQDPADDNPLPEPDLETERDTLLYQSQRTYFDQLRYYKRYRHGL